MPSRPTPYQAVIRRNMRRLRDENRWRQEDVAARARMLGLGWEAATVTGIELGRRQLSPSELLLLPTILRAPLAELLSAAGPVDLDGVTARPEAIARIGRGRALSDTEATWLLAVPMIEARATDAERKAAKKLSTATGTPVSVLDLIAASQRLWERRRLDEERDRRLAITPGGGDIARRRGHITSALVRELLAEFATADPLEPFKNATAKGRRKTRPPQKGKARK